MITELFIVEYEDGEYISTNSDVDLEVFFNRADADYARDAEEHETDEQVRVVRFVRETQ